MLIPVAAVGNAPFAWRVFDKSPVEEVVVVLLDMLLLDTAVVDGVTCILVVVSPTRVRTAKIFPWKTKK